MLRVALLIGLVTACGGSAKGPAWPKSAGDETDGGQSLAPKPGSVAINAAAADDDDDDLVVEKPAEKPATKASSGDDTAPRPTTPTITAPDDIINTDDLIIEIDD